MLHEPVKTNLKKVFQPAGHMGAQERELEQFLKEKLGAGSKAAPAQSEYMKLVEEETNLYKIPRHLDYDKQPVPAKYMVPAPKKVDEEAKTLEFGFFFC